MIFAASFPSPDRDQRTSARSGREAGRAGHPNSQSVSAITPERLRGLIRSTRHGQIAVSRVKIGNLAAERAGKAVDRHGKETTGRAGEGFDERDAVSAEEHRQVSRPHSTGKATGFFATRCGTNQGNGLSFRPRRPAQQFPHRFPCGGCPGIDRVNSEVVGASTPRFAGALPGAQRRGIPRPPFASTTDLRRRLSPAEPLSNLPILL